MTANRRLAWALLFGVAFGCVEAAVVVYLRRITCPEGFALPLPPLEPAILKVEIVREAATLLMLLGVANLAGRRGLERLAYFAFVFGIWDLVYYAGLRLALGWPASLADWDILFLLPLPWVAPVYAPVSVALLMVLAGAAAARREAAGRGGCTDVWTWLLGAGGSGLLLYSFMREPDVGLHGARPGRYPIELLLLGQALLISGCVRYFGRRVRRPARPTP